MHISWSKLLIGLVLGVVCVLGLGLWADFAKLRDAMVGFSAGILLAVFGLSLLNYALRTLRWHMYLRYVDVSVPAPLSVGVFLSGLAMSITPGKLGEVIKVGLLHESQGVPVSRTFPVVVSERLSDLFSILILAGIGVLRMGFGGGVFVGGVVLTAAFVAVLATPFGTRMLFAGAARLLKKKVDPALAEQSQACQKCLLSPVPLLSGILLGCAAWFAEALGLYLIVGAFEGGTIGVERATLVYAVGTLAGALSMLPGGLIATEATLVGMLSPDTFGALPTEAAAVAATLLVRIATLWFAVVLGLLGLLWMRRRLLPTVSRPG